MLVQGETTTNVPLRDSVLCMGNPIERIEVVFADANGDAETSGNLSVEDSVPSQRARNAPPWSRDHALSIREMGSNFT